MSGTFKDSAYYPLGCAEEQSMGEYEYQYALCAGAGEDDEGAQPVTPVGYWRVRGGAILEIRKMADEHLRNAINLLVRKGLGRHAKTRELKRELERRGG